ncbi:MAG: hypothetical protein HRT62_11195, partial [Epibacterium sp.]|nr:hypothetical protein [Epibacterium sp.]
MGLEWGEKQLAARALCRDHDEVMLYGGAGASKTWIWLELILTRALMAPGSRHGLFRVHFEHCTSSLWPSTKECCNLAYPGLWDSCGTNQSNGKWQLRMPNGSELWFGGLGEADKVEKWLSTEFCSTYVNEASQVKKYEDCEKLFARLRQKCIVPSTGRMLSHMAYLDMNPPSRKHWSFDRYVANVPEGVAVAKLTPRDNPHLPRAYIKRLERMSERQRKRFLDGDFTDDIEGALWSLEMIELTRSRHNHIGRTVVALDPSATSGPESDEAGIIVATGDSVGAHVLADYSGVMSPDVWSRRAVQAYHDHHADAIVIETNQGGDMIESLLRRYEPRIKIIKVHAK